MSLLEKYISSLIAVTLTFDLLTSKSNHLTFVLNCTKDVKIWRNSDKTSR